MFKLAQPFFLHFLSSLHAGSGNDLGYVDLPIQRERHTGYPKVEASGIKGCLREAFESIIKKENGKLVYAIKKEDSPLFKKFPELKEKPDIYYRSTLLAFGPEDAGHNAFAGALGFSDARILLFPVKSMKDVFVYVSSPYVLKRFRDDLQICADTGQINFNFSVLESVEESSVADEKITVKQPDDKEHYVILEEYSIPVKVKKETAVLAKWLGKLLGIKELEKRLVIVPDEEFQTFTSLFTEVITRTRIDNRTGTVQTGALFNEEYLPAETVLYILAFSSPVFNDEKEIFKANNSIKEEQKVLEFFTQGSPSVIQIGANATLGKGIARLIHWKEVKIDE